VGWVRCEPRAWTSWSCKDLTLRLEGRELGARDLLAELGSDTISEVEQRLFGDGTAPEVDGREGMAAVAAILAAIESEPLGRPVRRDEMLAGRVTGAQADIDRALGLTPGLA